MRVRVVETGHYLKKARRLLSAKEQDDLAGHLAENPLVHDLIPGTGRVAKGALAPGEPRQREARRRSRDLFFCSFR